MSVLDLKKYKSIRCFTREFLRELKYPILKNSTGTENAKGPGDPLNNFSASMTSVAEWLPRERPSFDIDNSNNILVLLGRDSDTKVIIESFL